MKTAGASCTEKYHFDTFHVDPDDSKNKEIKTHLL